MVPRVGGGGVEYGVWGGGGVGCDVAGYGRERGELGVGRGEGGW